MNYIKHLTGFFEKVTTDRTLNPTHISLYMALFQFWNCSRFKNPISINRDEIMRISKISSKATYHKCLRNLHTLGYINYQPSYNPFKGSHVILFNFSDYLKPVPKSERTTKNEPVFEQVIEQAVNKSCTSSGTGTEQALVPSINYINNTNISNEKNVSNLNEQAKNFEEINNSDFKIPKTPLSFGEGSGVRKKEKSSAKKEKDKNSEPLSFRQQEESRKPAIEDVKAYFQENNFPEIEAQKFFNYFSSVGWLVGGKTPMVNWNAAAQNWMIYAPKFVSDEQQQPDRAKQLNTTTDKDYSEPL